MNRHLPFVLLVLFLPSGFVQAQEAVPDEPPGTPWILSVYLSTWINRCDVPAASQKSSFTPALGPTFALSRGRWRMSLSGYIGDYDFEASGFSFVEGQTNGRFSAIAPGNTLIEFDNEAASSRGFTVDGRTRRQDLSAGLGYRFSNALQLGLSLEYNHRDAYYKAVLPLAVVASGVPAQVLDFYDLQPISGDPSGRSLLLGRGGYDIHQLWFGPQFHGFTPLSAHFGGFYNASFLLLAYESRRAPVYHDDEGQFFPPGANGSLLLEPRGFADNAGAAFSLGLSYAITPRAAFWGGYSLKFFAEANTDLLDNSIYQGPYFGVGYIFF